MRIKRREYCVYWIRDLGVSDKYPRYVDDLECFENIEDAFRHMDTLSRAQDTVEVSLLKREIDTATFTMKLSPKNEPCKSIAYKYLFTFCEAPVEDLENILQIYGCGEEEKDKIIDELLKKYGNLNTQTVEFPVCPEIILGEELNDFIRFAETVKGGGEQ